MTSPNFINIIILPSTYLPKTARESPRFIQVSDSGVYITLTQVEPLKLAIVLYSLRRSLFVERKVFSKNFTVIDLEACLQEYSNLNVLLISNDRTDVTLL